MGVGPGSTLPASSRRKLILMEIPMSASVCGTLGIDRLDATRNDDLAEVMVEVYQSA